MFGGNGEGVEEHQEDHEPVEDVRLNCCTALSPAESIPPAPVTAGTGQGGKDRLAGRWKLLLAQSIQVTSLLSLAWSYYTTWRWNDQATTKLTGLHCLVIYVALGTSILQL